MTSGGTAKIRRVFEFLNRRRVRIFHWTKDVTLPSGRVVRVEWRPLEGDGKPRGALLVAVSLTKQEWNELVAQLEAEVVPEEVVRDRAAAA